MHNTRKKTHFIHIWMDNGYWVFTLSCVLSFLVSAISIIATPSTGHTLHSVILASLLGDNDFT